MKELIDRILQLIKDEMEPVWLTGMTMTKFLPGTLDYTNYKMVVCTALLVPEMR